MTISEFDDESEREAQGLDEESAEAAQEGAKGNRWDYRFTISDNGNRKNGNGNDGNSDVIELELGPKLKESGIVTSFVSIQAKKS